MSADGWIPRVVHVVSHTHWDREWYLTFHEFRGRLVRVVDQVLDRLESDPDFLHFCLDGQAVILEDHLEIVPEDAERIRRLVERGALAIGPWYVLPDEFLISGESHVRNLLLGHRVCADLGGAQSVGYMPDSFGHVAQMPQWLRRAGLDSFVFTRGQGDEVDRLPWEFTWRAPDGCELLAVNQCGGYCNAGGLGLEELWHAHTLREPDPARAVEQVRERFEQMAKRAGGDLALLNNGCDHFPPQPGLGAILRALREAFPGTEFRHASLRDHVDAVREAGIADGTHEGEMRGGRDHLILSGVWSARMPLKQANDEAQTWLTAVAEPVAVHALATLGRPAPRGLLLAAWKSLLRNHPHDSICGCSTDEVHRDMMPRFAGTIRTARDVVRDHLERLAPSFGVRPEDDRDTAIVVFNPLPVRRSAVVDRLVVLQPLGYDLDALALVSENGAPVPFEIVDRWIVERFWGIDYRSELSGEDGLARFRVYRETFGDRMLRDEDRLHDSDVFLHVRFLAEDLPALGHARFLLRDDGGDPPPAGEVRVDGNTISNGLVAAILNDDGTFDLVDSVTGDRYPGLAGLVDVADVGDEYDFAPVADASAVASGGITGTVEVVEAGGLRGALRVSYDLVLPVRASDDRRGRVEDAVACPVSVTVTLDEASPLIDIDVRFENRAEDHRLRMAFPTFLTSDRLVSDGPHVVHDRPVATPSGENWVQPPPGTFPQQSLSAVEDGERGLAVFSRGLPEVEPTRDAYGAGLEVTLLRAVGWLSRDDFETRRCANAGPTIATPEAQCPGRHRFSLAVLPYRAGWLQAGVVDASERWRTPLPTKQGVVAPGIPGGGSLLERGTTRTSVSAVKPHEDRDTIVVRVVNLGGQPVDETLTFGVPVRAAWATDLLEKRLEPLPIEHAHRVALALGPHEIATVEVVL